MKTFADTLAEYADELARGETLGAASRELAFHLAPLAERIAFLTAQGANRSERREFADEALSLLLGPREGASPIICRFDGVSSLETWLSVVLRNLWISKQRKNRRHTRNRIDVENALDSAAAPVWTEQPEALTSPFSKTDLETLQSWAAGDRIELLCLAGLWLKVPPLLWESWLVDCERARGRTLLRPFPPQDFLLYDLPRERTSPLACLLGYDRTNTLAVRWTRGKVRLESLNFFLELREAGSR